MWHSGSQPSLHVDGVAGFLGMLLAMTAAGQWRPERGANLLDSGAPFYDVYACADGRYVAVGAIEERFYAALLAGLDLVPHELPDRADPANWPEVRRRFAERFAGRTRDEWAAAFDGTDACVTPVLSVAEAATYPGQRAYVVRDGLTQPAPAPRFSRTPPELPDGAPEPGSHSREVLTEYGFSAAEIGSASSGA